VTQIWRTGEEHIHPVLACEREEAFQALKRIWVNRRLQHDQELQEATMAFAVAHAKTLAAKGVAKAMFGEDVEIDPYRAEEPTQGADHAA
jgi:hypothetical protein